MSSTSASTGGAVDLLRNILSFFSFPDSLSQKPPMALNNSRGPLPGSAGAAAAAAIVDPLTHPYYPVGVEIIGYMANEWNTVQLCGMFAAGCTVIFLSTFAVVKRVRPNISVGDLGVLLWFVLCGFIHLFFEGYFAYNFQRMGGMQDLFGQLWKEYSLSDSRYLTQDAFVLCMETITAVFWGPLSFLTASLIATDHPLRYPLQTIVSLGQLYGDVLYYATSMFDHWILDLTYSRPERFYFWGYFVFMNAFWIVIPFWLMCSSVGACWRALAAVEKVDGVLKAQQAGNGAVGKKGKKAE